MLDFYYQGVVMHKFKSLSLIAGLSLTLALSGCSAVHTAVKKRNLDVQTKMSETVFLDPVSQDKKTVFLQIRNTSDKQSLDIKNAIASAIAAKGYKLLEDPDAAHYWLQANILKVGKSDLRESQGALSQGYGGALAGAQFGNGSGRVGSSLLGAAAGIIGDAMVDDTYFTMITDIQISEKPRKGVIITESNTATLKQGTSGNKSVSSTEQVDRKKYQTRIVSTANKANLAFEEAQPVLKSGLVNSISGLL